jgi:hypothetical protein
MNPSANFATAGLSFQLSSPIESRDGSIFEQHSDLRPHDDSLLKEASLELAERRHENLLVLRLRNTLPGGSFPTGTSRVFGSQGT